MNNLYRILIQIFIATIITVATTSAYAGVGVNDNGEPPVVARNYNPGVIPPYAKVHGKSYGDWGAQWWKWALKGPIAQSPILDDTGQYGSQNQNGPVWYLAGSFGTKEERWITIPNGKSIFFPLVNMWNDYPCPDPKFKPEPGQTMEEFLTLGVAPLIDPWVTEPENTLSAKVDGVQLKNLLNYRGISHLTKFTADPSQIAIDPCITGQEQVAVSDGFWIMLTPLKPGKHTIEFSAFALSKPWPFDLHVTYHVKISKDTH